MSALGDRNEGERAVAPKCELVLPVAMAPSYNAALADYSRFLAENPNPEGCTIDPAQVYPFIRYRPMLSGEGKPGLALFSSAASGRSCFKTVSKRSKGSSCSSTRHREKENARVLANQARIQRSTQPYACFCGKSFRTKDSLTKHSRVHTGHKPYKCPVCSKCFTQNSSMRLHLRIHNEDKRFECSECGKRFTQKGNLVCHMRIHTGERPFECDKCPMKFAQMGQLRKHSKNIHP